MQITFSVKVPRVGINLRKVMCGKPLHFHPSDIYSNITRVHIAGPSVKTNPLKICVSISIMFILTSVNFLKGAPATRY